MSIIAEDVAMIGAQGRNRKVARMKIFGSFLNELKDTQVINAAKYEM